MLHWQIFNKKNILFLLLLIIKVHLQQPITFSYINNVNINANASFGQQFFYAYGAKNSTRHNYNHLALAYWTCQSLNSQSIQIWNTLRQRFGVTQSNNQVVKTIVQEQYHGNKIKIMVSAFGDKQNPISKNIDPIQCAQKLANYMSSNSLDGVDINIRDVNSLVNNKLNLWLQKFIKKLRQKINDKIISISAISLFYSTRFPGLINLSKQIRDSYINFFNIIYQNQFGAKFQKYQEIFKSQNNVILNGTSVSQLIKRGINKQKIIIGFSVKYIQQNIKPDNLNNFLIKAFKQLQWKSGIMTTQFSQDSDGKILKQAAISFLITSSQTKRTTTSSQNDIIINRTIHYPIKFGYINSIQFWWGQKILNSLGVPGYSDHKYNYLALAFWYCHQPGKKSNSVIQFQGHTVDVVSLWKNIYSDYGLQKTAKQMGSNDRISFQRALKKKYNEKGIKILISAFGGTYYPTQHIDTPEAEVCATRLANFVINHNTDGVDINYQDTRFLHQDRRYNWLSTFSKKLRQLLPNHIISHAPQAPYFDTRYLHSYTQLEKDLSNKNIDFYNIQFYNQGPQYQPSLYENYQSIFVNSLSRTSILQINKKGIQLDKLVVGKPVTKFDAGSSTLAWGLVNNENLGTWAQKAYDQFDWKAGIMFWQFKSDNKELKQTGKSAIQSASKKLENKLNNN